MLLLSKKESKSTRTWNKLSALTTTQRAIILISITGKIKKLVSVLPIFALVIATSMKVNFRVILDKLTIKFKQILYT